MVSTPQLLPGHPYPLTYPNLCPFFLIKNKKASKIKQINKGKNRIGQNKHVNKK